MEEEYYIKEKLTPNNFEIMDAESLESVVQKMPSIVKIYCEDGGFGTGYLVNIPFPDQNHLLPVLMTNNHVLEGKDITIGKKIKITFKNDNKTRFVNINNKRKVYTSKKYDTTIIEIFKKEDKVENIPFLEIDEQSLFVEDPDQKYRNTSVYMLHYLLGDKLDYSPGKIITIDKIKSNIQHSCSTEMGSSGGPLFNCINHKIIGIHKGCKKDKEYNFGTLIKTPINEFNKKFKKTTDIKEQKEQIFINNSSPQKEKEQILIINSPSKKEKEQILMINPSPLKEKDKNKNKGKINKKEKEELIDEITIRYKKREIGLIDTITSFLVNDAILGENISQNKIFGEKFVENNKFNCKIVINGVEQNLVSSYNIPSNNIFEIKLKGISKIKDISYMFYGCSSFLESPDIHKWNTSKIINMSGVFWNCNSITTLPDISKWDTSNVINISNIFQGCNSLISLPDISIWNTENVTDMSGIFWNCNSLRNIPDISKWKTNNVKNMSYMFCLCNSLISLPNLSNWNTTNVLDMSFMFNRCYSLNSIRGVSKWNTKNVVNMKYMFCECKALIDFDDISKWDISNLKNYDEMFKNCNNNINIPQKFEKQKKWLLF